MMCYPCLNDGQMAGRLMMTPAITVFNGQAVCLSHLNAVRGLPPEWGMPVSNAPSVPTPHLVPVQAAPAPPVAPVVPAPTPVPVPVAAPVRVSLPSETGDGVAEVHEECRECGNYATVHYQPEIDHCSCGSAWVAGQCDTQLDSDSLEGILLGSR